MFQEASLFPHLSVLANLEFGLKRIAKTQRRVDMAHATELLGISHLLDRHPQHLSGGERQRVGIARAFMLAPALLLADEPVASLDPRISRDILTLLRDQARERGATVLCSLHQVDLAREFADRIVALRQGSMVFDGPASAFDEATAKALYQAGDPAAPREAGSSIAELPGDGRRLAAQAQPALLSLGGAR
ncbi:Arginine transport ATP-binding protein ArtP [compost metagenome]